MIRITGRDTSADYGHRFIDTPTNSGVMEGEKGIQAQVEKVAMGRMGTADEVASVVGFLFSDDSKYMNGSVIEVNGGTG